MNKSTIQLIFEFAGLILECHFIILVADLPADELPYVRRRRGQILKLLVWGSKRHDLVSIAILDEFDINM